MHLVGGILCGGLGKRLRPLTDTVPKALIELKDGYTVLDHQLSKLKYAGINKVYLLVGHLHNKIEEKYGKEWKGVKLEYLVEDKPRGTLYAINNLLSSMNAGEVAVVMNGDVVSDVNLKEMLMNWTKGTVSMFITLLTSPYGIVEAVHDGKIVSFREKPKLPYYINGGVYIIPKELEEHFRTYQEGDVEKLVFPKLARMGLLRGYREDDVFWQSIDSLKDLENLRSEYRNRHDTPWGYEKTLVSTEGYMTKTVYIMKGYTTPLHVHKVKDETLHIVKGEGIVTLNGENLYVKSEDVIRIKPGTTHAVTALENLLMHEYSTPHPEDLLELNNPYA
ncbi:MAG: glucose-1-phosphate adenylyltransferase [Thermoprotei archaeon]|nr:MAG: glucose-1-phosphate adenylyltransferase [Thermoprotei archaeon]